MRSFAARNCAVAAVSCLAVAVGLLIAWPPQMASLMGVARAADMLEEKSKDMPAEPSTIPAENPPAENPPAEPANEPDKPAEGAPGTTEVAEPQGGVGATKAVPEGSAKGPEAETGKAVPDEPKAAPEPTVTMPEVPVAKSPVPPLVVPKSKVSAPPANEPSVAPYAPSHGAKPASRVKREWKPRVKHAYVNKSKAHTTHAQALARAPKQMVIRSNQPHRAVVVREVRPKPARQLVITTPAVTHYDRPASVYVITVGP